ncbi:MAG: MBOAT family protein [Firmicutes bacterium]|nr:MBOAT family protein [Bacillota bacterium]
MVFSSLIFLFLYLPAVLLIYYIVPPRGRNVFLLIANLVFYGWGEPVFVLIMAASVVSNFIFGLLIDKYRDNKRLSKTFVIFALAVSFGLLGAFKYAGFFADILRQIPLLSMLPKIKLSLPIGISFYTFQAVSYIIDVYRNDTPAQKSIVNFGTYISFFPQLIAGPIVRYADIREQLENRRESINQFADGIRVFTVGLAKKVLIANQMGLFWESVKDCGNDMGTLGAWIGIAAYTLQIYFDFSGYSDMAVGLGRMFGFEFMRNFNYPYVSESITDFWRRWHISLSSWFRDYVYIPLGGNRRKTPRVIFNLFVVWALTGFWHGASFNFIFWGVYYFVLLVLEKYVYGKYLERLPSAFRHIYALFFVMIGWVIFTFESGSEMLDYFRLMFTPGNGVIGGAALSASLSYLPLGAAAVIACTPLGKNVWCKIKSTRVCGAAEIVLCAAALVICTAALVSDSYNPFLYFRF